MIAAYGKSGLKAANYGNWSRYSVHAYPSATHGGRFVNNYANAKGSAYGKFENAGKLPVGSVLAKPSFQVTPGGKAAIGPLFLMEKMKPGFRVESGDWKYTMIMPTGAIAGVTNGQGSGNVEFCIACHAAVGEDQDHLFFLPDDLRISN
ncbi:MAG: cytochrome P460 family protein [Minwuia sp.]|nr:cytochrome P460 family protein [Minwuia sp.]